MIVSLIVAMDKNRLIGDGKKIPWHLPADFAYFKETTTGHPIIMGRTTFESIGRPLPNRKNIILTHRDFDHEGVEVAHSLDEALELAKDTEEVFVIGGAHVYEQTLSSANKLYITYIDGDFTGDTFFPEVDFAQWRQTKNEIHKSDEKNQNEMRFTVFERIK